MFGWMFVNYKAVIAMAIAVLSSIVVPLILSGSAFVLSTNQTKANVQEHSGRISKLELVVYRMDAKFDLIQNSLKIIEERNYQELKESRQKRRDEKQ